MGKQINKQVDEESRAMLRNFKVRLKSLASRKGADIRAVCTLELTSRMTALRSAVTGVRQLLDIATVNRIHGVVVKHVSESSFGRGAAIRLSASTVEDAIQVLSDSIGAVANRPTRPTRESMNALAKRLTATVADLCSKGDSYSVWPFALDFTRQVARTTSLSWDNFLSEEQLGPIYDILCEGALSCLSRSVEAGDLVTADRLVAGARGHGGLSPRIKKTIQSLLTDRASLLPTVSQKWLLKEMGNGSSPEPFEYSNPGDSPDVRQAASLLLLLFDQSGSGVVSNEIFDRFRSLCERHFKLFLRGEVGQTVTFDSRLHETPGQQTRRVRLVRPWVECYNPPQSRVVIRAIVESEDGGTGRAQ